MVTDARTVCVKNVKAQLQRRETPMTKRSDADTGADLPKPPNTIPWPPILYLLTLVLAYGLQWLWPLPTLIGPPINSLLGWPLLLLGICLGLAAIVRFRSVGTPVDPTTRATVLATRGIYQWTRNPMYLGATLALFGLGLATSWTWLVVLCLILPMALTKLAIQREEAYLDQRFGEPYQAYKSAVRRWL
jgi:protein-S-isoprenylcysteine O-methyltransferase Ste14